MTTHAHMSRHAPMTGQASDQISTLKQRFFRKRGSIGQDMPCVLAQDMSCVERQGMSCVPAQKMFRGQEQEMFC